MTSNDDGPISQKFCACASLDKFYVMQMGKVKDSVPYTSVTNDPRVSEYVL